MKRRSEIVSFRVDAELAKRIDSARGVFDISRGDWVRGLVTAHLGQFFADDPNDCLDHVDEVLGQLSATTDQTQTGVCMPAAAD